MNYKHKTSPFTVFLRIIFTACLIYSVVFIFQNSLEIAEVSGRRSEEIQQIINAIAGKVGLGPFSLHLIRKLAHFGEFMVMGFWFMLCLRVYTRHFIKHISWPLLFGLGTAVSDETIQMFVEGRGSSVRDVWIDFGGFIAGLFVALFILMFFRMCTILFIHRNDDLVLQQENLSSKGRREETQPNTVRHKSEAARYQKEYYEECVPMKDDEWKMDVEWKNEREEQDNYDTDILY